MNRIYHSLVFSLLTLASLLSSCGNEEEVVFGNKFEPYPELLDYEDVSMAVSAAGGHVTLPLNEGVVSNLWLVTGRDLLGDPQPEGMVWRFTGETYHSDKQGVGIVLSDNTLNHLSAGDIVCEPMLTDYGNIMKENLVANGVKIISPEVDFSDKPSLIYNLDGWAIIRSAPIDQSDRWVEVVFDENRTDNKRVVTLCFWGYERFIPWQGPLFEINNIVRITQPSL